MADTYELLLDLYTQEPIDISMITDSLMADRI